jgi:hypothetical protein
LPLVIATVHEHSRFDRTDALALDAFMRPLVSCTATMSSDSLTFEDLPEDQTARDCIAGVVRAGVIAPLTMKPMARDR